MPANDGAIPPRWLGRALAATFPAASAGHCVALKGDASTRRYWRVELATRPAKAPATVIVADLGPEDLPLYARALGLLPQPLTEPPFLTLQAFLKRIGVAVPEIYYARPGERMLLLEDVGVDSLAAVAVHVPGETRAHLYRAAIDQLLSFHIDGTRCASPTLCARQVAYDERLFNWELEQFLDVGLKRIVRQVDRGAIARELGELAHRLGAAPRVLSHRDFHAANLFVQGDAGHPRIRVLDFQDALMAPPAQDLSVLLTTRDAADAITPELERRLLDYYIGCRARRGAPLHDLAAFHESYRLCVLQHALKVVGRFVWLEQEGRHGYARYLPYALAQARRMLAASDGFASLRAALKE